MAKFKQKVLNNELTIISIPQKGSLATTVLVLVRAGSKYETKNINGISHLLEHMCFKGTKKRPTAMDVASAFEDIGAMYNAFTTQEFTGYYAKVENSKTAEAIDLVADLYLNPIFDPEETEREKGPVIEEIRMRADNPQIKVLDVFPSLLYGDQPAGWDVAGTPEIIKALPREAVLDYRNAHYVAKGTIVIIAGGFDQKKVEKELEKHFKGISHGDKADKIKTKESQAKPGLLIVQKSSEQSHLVFGFRSYDTYDEKQYALDILSEILGGGMSSRLFHRIRERMGAAYYVGSFNDEYTDHGFLAARAGSKNELLEKVIVAMIEEFEKLMDKKVTKEELERAKTQVRSGLVLGLESSNAVAQYYGGQALLNKPLKTPEEELKKYMSVTAEQIQKVAREVFQNNRMNLAVIGPIKDEAKLKSILKIGG